MRKRTIIFLTLAAIAVPRAGLAQPSPTSEVIQSEESARSQIIAASSNAMDSLRRDIEQRRIDPTSNLTVGDFLDRTAGEDHLAKTLRRAEQIGGPRWVDEQTCQVKLEIGGDQVAQTLVEIALTDPRRSPIAVDLLEQRLTDWKRRSFAATGTSIRADRAAQVRPVGAADAWRTVDDRAREAAVSAARDSAAQRVLDTIKPVQIVGAQSVGDVLAANDAINKHLTDWLRARPVTSLRYTDALEVQYQPAVTADDLLDELIREARQANVALPDDPAAMAKARDELRNRLAKATLVGRATATAGAQPPETGGGQGIVFAAQTPPPDWIFNQIDAEGTASARPSLLRTKQAAEDQATQAIRDKFLALQLSPGQSIGDATKTDPAVRAAVDRAMSRVRVYKVDYGPKGEVTVKMMMDPREFWWDLTRP